MTDQIDIEALGKRAAECWHWRWLPGMRYRVDAMPAALHGKFRRLDDTASAGPRPWAVVDLRDPATLGCLLALVRDAWGEALYVKPTLEGFSVVIDRTMSPMQQLFERCLVFSGASEAEALVAALEAAPR